MGNLGQDSWWIGWDSNQAPPEYKSWELLLVQCVWCWIVFLEWMVSKVLYIQRKKGDKRQLLSGEQVFCRWAKRTLGSFITPVSENSLVKNDWPSEFRKPRDLKLKWGYLRNLLHRSVAARLCWNNVTCAFYPQTQPDKEVSKKIGIRWPERQ